ncbi:LysR family transcriptional regulator [Thiosulfatihalobacter marinus]|uniref:LysR family transcriptional regulator n=1 Tax=Thiosulfatihalobacter marinus TaxID=2792481 RepID=UPI0018D74E5A|nr:LysR family transcriptional regulator [Thiosulfatihalobacter marinus]
MKHLQDFRFIEAVARAGSIRKAAEDMNITASALNRRINRFEEEFGYEIFERLPRGVRLNPAGELLIQHARAQKSDLARLQSQVADLSGERRGHISIACSQALLPYFLPAQIARYRSDHTGVTFSVNVRDRVEAERELSTFSSDIALVFEPRHLVDFEVITSIAQPIHVVMRAGHSLAGNRTVRLRDCLDYPHVAPSRQFAIRVLLDDATKKSHFSQFSPIAESESFEFMRHYVLHEDAIAFQFPIGLDFGALRGLAARPLSLRDVAPGNLLLGQLRGRTLPVASAKFSHQLSQALQSLAV